ncbi:hypothetical protein D7W09_02175 [bacterium D16-34]|nr:hypothetical protein D7W09_02175 [bacterium D16-34]
MFWLEKASCRGNAHDLSVQNPDEGTFPAILLSKSPTRALFQPKLGIERCIFNGKARLACITPGHKSCSQILATNASPTQILVADFALRAQGMNAAAVKEKQAKEKPTRGGLVGLHRLPEMRGGWARALMRSLTNRYANHEEEVRCFK